MKITIIFGSLALILMTSASVSAQTYMVVQAKLNQVMEPQSMTDAFQACIQDMACKFIVDSAMNYFGIPSDSVTSAIAQIPRQEYVGEESFFTFQLPSGYSYCNSRTETISIVPRDGSRASLMRVTSIPRGLDIYTWTPRQAKFDGRSWVEANVMIVGVQNSYAEAAYASGSCRRPGKELTNCRGNGTGGDGRPACGVVKD